VSWKQIGRLLRTLFLLRVPPPPVLRAALSGVLAADDVELVERVHQRV
jgi:hypothetical protein